MNNTKAKKKHKKRHPNAPTGTRSAYQFFSMHIRPTVVAENRGASWRDICGILSGRWKAVGINERKEWNDKAAEDKVRYKHEMANYDGNEYYVDDDTINHHLQEHMTYKLINGKERTTFIPEVKLATTNDQGKIVAGDYFKINDVEFHKINKRADAYKFVLKKSPDQVNAVCGDSLMIGAWNNFVNNTDDNSDQQQQPQPQQQLNDGGINNRAFGSDAAQPQQLPTGGRLNYGGNNNRANGTIVVPNGRVAVDDADSDEDADVDVDGADGDTDDTMAFTEKLTKFKKSFAIIIYKRLLQAFGNKGIFIKCCGCESFLPISRYGITRRNLFGLNQYCRRCQRIQLRFNNYNWMWLFVARPVDTTTASGVDSSTTTTASSRPAAVSDASATTTASGVDSTTTTTAAAASDPSGGTTTGSGVDSTTATPFLSRNYTWFGKEVPDGTTLDTSPGITWEQYRIFSNMWKNEDGIISVCHLCKKPEIRTIDSKQIEMVYQLEYIIVDNSVVPAFNAGGGNNNHAANGSDAVQPQPQPQHQTNGGGNNNHAANGSDAVQPQPQQQSNGGGNTGRNSVNPYGNNVSDTYYQDGFHQVTAMRGEEKERHDTEMKQLETEMEKAQSAYDGVCDELDSTKNKLRAMRNANTHWYGQYNEVNIQKKTYKNVAEDAHKKLEKKIEELASVKMMHDVHKNQKEKYKHDRDLYKASYEKEKLEHEELKDKYNKMKRDRERDEWKEKELKRGCSMM